jgi:hypothetical protein
MTKREIVLHEFLKDPLLIQRGYLPKREVIDIEVTSPYKMVELIKTVVNAKDKKESDNAVRAAVNRFLNSTT